MDYSIIEFGVYGFFAYGSMLMLMITMIRDVPATRALTLARSMYAIPGIFSAVIISGFGVNISFPHLVTNTYNASTNVLITNATQTETLLLVNPVWTYFHGLLAAILIVFVIFQILQMLTSKD